MEDELHPITADLPFKVVQIALIENYCRTEPAKVLTQFRMPLLDLVRRVMNGTDNPGGGALFPSPEEWVMAFEV